MGLKEDIIKEYVHRRITFELDELRSRENDLEHCLFELRDLDLSHANYEVVIKSLWENQGGNSVNLTYTGSSLRYAITNTQNEFRRLNQGGNIQADYKVYLLLLDEDRRFMIPERYWAEFI